MTLRERAESTAGSIYGLLELEPAKAQAAEVTKVIEQAIIDAVLDERERCVHVAADCCSADKDTAHKIAEEIRRARGALIANLQGMR